MTDQRTATIRAVIVATLAAVATALADGAVTTLEWVAIVTAAVTAWGSGPVIRSVQARNVRRRYRSLL